MLPPSGRVRTAGRYEEAEAVLREATRLSRDNPVPWRNLGGAQHMLGRFADAASSLQKSLEIAPNAIVHSNLGPASSAAAVVASGACFRNANGPRREGTAELHPRLPR